MIRKESNIYEKLDRIVCDVLRNIDEETKGVGEEAHDKGGTNYADEKSTNERVYKKFFELFNRESYIEKLTHDELVATYRDKNAHKYLFYMFEYLHNKITQTRNVRHVDFLFLILRYITYLWFLLSNDDKLVLIFYYYFKLVDLLFNLKFVRCSFFVNIYNLLIYFYMKDKRKKKKIIFPVKKLREKEAGFHIKNVISELNKIIANENAHFMETVGKRNNFVNLHSHSLSCGNAERKEFPSNTEEDAFTCAGIQNVYDYLWVGYHQGENDPHETKHKNKHTEKIESDSTEEDKSFVLITKCQNWNNENPIFPIFSIFSVTSSYNFFLNITKHLFKISVYDFSTFFPLLSMLNVEFLLSHFHLFEILHYVQMEEMNSDIGDSKKETKIVSISSSQFTPYKSNEQVTTEGKEKTLSKNQGIFSNNNKSNKKILWNILFEELKKVYIVDTKNVNYTLKMLKYSFSFFLFEEKIVLKNNEWGIRVIKKGEHTFAQISQVYLKELLKFSLSFVNNLMSSITLNEEVVFKAISYVFYLLSKLICNTINNLRKYILLNNDNNLALVALITYIYKYFKRVYLEKNAAGDVHKGNAGAVGCIEDQNKLKYTFVTLEKVYQKIQECLYVVLTVDESVESNIKKKLVQCSDGGMPYSDGPQGSRQNADNCDLYFYIIIKINKMNMFYSNLEIIKILSQKDKNVFRKYIYTINKNNENFCSFFSCLLNIDYKENQHELLLKKYMSNLKEKKNYKNKKLIKLMKPYHSPLKYIILKNEIDQDGAKKSSARKSTLGVNFPHRDYDIHTFEGDKRKVIDLRVRRKSMYDFGRGEKGGNPSSSLQRDHVMNGHTVDGDTVDDITTDETSSHETLSDENTTDGEEDKPSNNPANCPDRGCKDYFSEGLKRARASSSHAKVKKKEMPIFENSILRIRKKQLDKTNIDFKNVCHSMTMAIKRCILISDSMITYFKTYHGFEANFNIYICKNIYINFLRVCLLCASLFSYLCVKLNYDEILKQMYDSNLIIMSYNIFDKYISFVLDQDVKRLRKYKNVLQVPTRQLNRGKTGAGRSSEATSSVNASTAVKEQKESFSTVTAYTQLHRDEIYDVLGARGNQGGRGFFLSDQDEFIETIYLNTFMIVINVISVWELYLEIPVEVLNKMKYTFFELFYNTTIKIIKFIKKDKGFFFLLNILKFIYLKFVSLPFNPINIHTSIKLHDFYDFLINDGEEDVKKEEEQKFNSEDMYMNSISPLKFLINPDNEAQRNNLINSVQKLNIHPDDHVLSNEHDYNTFSVNKKKRVSMGGLVPVFLNNNRRKRRRTSVGPYTSYDSLENNDNGSYCTVRNGVSTEHARMDDQTSTRVKYDLGGGEYESENIHVKDSNINDSINVTPKRNYDYAQPEERKESENFRNTYLSNYYIPHIDLLFIIVDLEVFHYFEKKEYKKIIFSVENTFKSIISKCDYNTKEYLRSSISYIYNFYQQVHLSDSKINIQSCTVIRHIFNLYIKSKVFYLSKKIKKKLAHYRSSYSNDGELKMGYNKIYDSLFSSEKWKNFFYIFYESDNLRQNKRMEIINNLLIVHINTLLFLIFYEYLSKYVTKKFIFFFRFFLFFFNKLCVAILSLVNSSNHLEIFNLFDWQNIARENYAQDEEQLANKIRNAIRLVQNCSVYPQDEEIFPQKIYSKRGRHTNVNGRSNPIVMVDIDELLVTYIQLNFTFCRSCCFFIFFKNVCSQKYENILKENFTSTYFERFKNNRDLFDPIDAVKDEKTSRNDNNWGVSHTAEEFAPNEEPNVNDSFDDESDDNCRSDSSSSGLSQSSFTLIEYTDYSKNEDYIFLEFILEKIEEMDVDYYYSNVLNNCYYVIKIETLYNYIYKNEQLLRRFSFLNNVYYLYKLYYHMFVWSSNKSHVMDKKDVATEGINGEKKLSKLYNDIFYLFDVNRILGETFCSKYVHLIDQAGVSDFTPSGGTPDKIAKMSPPHGYANDYGATERRSVEESPYFLCDIYNFKLKLFHPLNFEKRHLAKGKKKNTFDNFLMVNKNYLLDLKHKYGKIKKYINNYMVYLYHIILHFYYNEYGIDREKLSFHYIVYSFQSAFDTLNSNILCSRHDTVCSSSVQGVGNEKGTPPYVPPFNIISKCELKKNILLIFDILNNIYDVYHGNIFENSKWADSIVTQIDTKLIGYLSEIYKIAYLYKMYHCCMCILVLCLLFTSKFWLIYVFNEKHPCGQQVGSCHTVGGHSEYYQPATRGKRKVGSKPKEKSVDKGTLLQNGANLGRGASRRGKPKEGSYESNEEMTGSPKGRRAYILTGIYDKILSKRNEVNTKEIYNDLHNYMQMLIVCTSIFYLSFLCIEKIQKNLQNIYLLNCANSLYNCYVQFYEYIEKFCKEHCEDKLYASSLFFDTFHLDLINLKLQAHVKAGRYKAEMRKMKKILCESSSRVSADSEGGVTTMPRSEHSRERNRSTWDKAQVDLFSNFPYLLYYNENASMECISDLRRTEKKYQNDGKNFFKNNICLYFNMVRYLYKKRSKYTGLLPFVNSYIISIVTLMKFTIGKYFSSFNVSFDFFSLKFEYPIKQFDMDMLTKVKKTDDEKENIKLTNKAILMNLENLYCNMFLNKDMCYQIKFVYTYYKKISSIMYKMNNFVLSYYYLKRNILFVCDLIYLPDVVHNYLLLMNIILKSGRERIELLTQEEIFFENLNNQLSIYYKKNLDQDTDTETDANYAKDKTVKDVNDFKIYEDSDFCNIDYVKTPLNTYLTKRHIYEYRNMLNQFLAYLTFLMKNPDHSLILSTKRRREILHMLCLILFTKRRMNYFCCSKARPKKSKDVATNGKGTSCNHDNAKLSGKKCTNEKNENRSDQDRVMSQNVTKENPDNHKIKHFEKNFLICFNNCNEKKEETFFNFFLEKLFIISNIDTDVFDVELEDEEQVESLIKSQVLRDVSNLNFVHPGVVHSNDSFLNVGNEISSEQENAAQNIERKTNQTNCIEEEIHLECHRSANSYYSFKINDISVLNYLYLNYNFEQNLTYTENYITNRFFIFNCRKMNIYFVKILLYYINLIFLKIKNIFCDDCVYTIKKQQFLNSSANDCSRNIFFFLFINLFRFFNFSNRTLSELCANYFPGNKNYASCLDELYRSKKYGDLLMEVYANDGKRIIEDTKTHNEEDKENNSDYNLANGLDKMLMINFFEIFLYPHKNCSLLEVLTVCYEFLINMKDDKWRKLRKRNKHKMYALLKTAVTEWQDRNNPSVFYFQIILVLLSLLLHYTCKGALVHEMRKVAQFFLDFVFFFIENIKNNLIILQIIEAYGEGHTDGCADNQTNDHTDGPVDGHTDRHTDRHTLGYPCARRTQVNLLKFYFRKLLSLLYLYTDELILYTIKNNIDQEISQKNYYRKHAHENLNIETICNYEYICQSNLSELCFYWDYAIVSMSHDKSDLYISRCFKNFLFVLIRIIREETHNAGQFSGENEAATKGRRNYGDKNDKRRDSHIEEDKECFNFYSKINNLFSILNDEDLCERLFIQWGKVSLSDSTIMGCLNKNANISTDDAHEVYAVKKGNLNHHSDGYNGAPPSNIIKSENGHSRGETIIRENATHGKGKHSKVRNPTGKHFENDKMGFEQLHNPPTVNIFFTSMGKGGMEITNELGESNKITRDKSSYSSAPYLSNEKDQVTKDIQLVKFFSRLYKNADRCIENKTSEYFHVEKIHLNIERFPIREKWNYIKKLEKILKQYQHMIKIMCEILHESKNVDRNKSNLKMFIDLWWNNRYTLEQHLKILNLDISNTLGFSIHKLMSIPLISLNIRTNIVLNNSANWRDDDQKEVCTRTDKDSTQVNSAYNTLSIVNNQKYYLSTNFDLFLVLYYYSHMLNIIAWINKWGRYFVPSRYWDTVHFVNVLLNLTVFSIVLKNCNVQITHAKRKYLRWGGILDGHPSRMDKGESTLIGSNMPGDTANGVDSFSSRSVTKGRNDNRRASKSLIPFDKNVVTSYLPFINKDIETILFLEERKKKNKRTSTEVGQPYLLDINPPNEGKKRTIVSSTHRWSVNLQEGINQNDDCHSTYKSMHREGVEHVESISTVDNKYRIVIPKRESESAYPHNSHHHNNHNSHSHEKKGRRRTINVISEQTSNRVDSYCVDRCSIYKSEKQSRDEKKVNSTIYGYVSPLKTNIFEHIKNEDQSEILTKEGKRKRTTVAGTLNLDYVKKQENKDEKNKENIYLKYLDLKKKCDRGVLKCSFLKLRMYLYNILIDIFENNNIHPKNIFNLFNIITHSFIMDVIKCTMVDDELDHERLTYVKNVEHRRIRKTPVVVYIHNNLNRLPFENLEPLKDSYIVRGVHKAVTAYLYGRVMAKIKVEESKVKRLSLSSTPQAEMDAAAAEEEEEGEMEVGKGTRQNDDESNNSDHQSDDSHMDEYIKQEYSKKWKIDNAKNVYQMNSSTHLTSVDLRCSHPTEWKRKNSDMPKSIIEHCNTTQLYNKNEENKNVSKKKGRNSLSYILTHHIEVSKNYEKNNDKYQHEFNTYQVKASNRHDDQGKVSSQENRQNALKSQRRNTLTPYGHETLNITGHLDDNYDTRIVQAKGKGRYSLVVSSEEAKDHLKKEHIHDKDNPGEGAQDTDTKEVRGKRQGKKSSRKSICIEHSFLNPFNNNNTKKGQVGMSFSGDHFNGKDSCRKKKGEKKLSNRSPEEKHQLRLSHSAKRRGSIKRINPNSSCPSYHSRSSCASSHPLSSESESESASSVELIQNEEELRKIFMSARKSMNMHNMMGSYKNEEYSFFRFKKKRKKSVSESEAYFDEEKKFSSSCVDDAKRDNKRRSYSADPDHHSKASKMKYVKYVPYYIKSSRLVDPKRSNIFFVINPNGDLKRTEDATYPFIYFKNKDKYKYKNWNGYFGKVPCEKTLLKHLCCDDLYVYCGHQGGEQYIKKDIIQNAILRYEDPLGEGEKVEEAKEGNPKKEQNRHGRIAKSNTRKTENKDPLFTQNKDKKRRNSCNWKAEKRILDKGMKRKSVGDIFNIHSTSESSDALCTQTEMEDNESNRVGDPYFSTNPNDGINSCVFLIGCSSGLLSSHGFDLDVWGTPYDYIVGGCVFVFGNLWNVTDGEVDGFTQNFFWKWTQPNSSSLFCSNYNYNSVQMEKVSTFCFRFFAKILRGVSEIHMREEDAEWDRNCWKDDDNDHKGSSDDLLIEVGDNFVTINFHTYTYLKKNYFFYKYFQKCYNCNIVLNQNLFSINQNRKYSWLSMTEALAEAKQFCRLPNTTGSAVVIYGLPL
ncbi:C50 peptidase, putative [Plasmodium knowlesi strain H]|uniref:separase n=3 Tax=Plasmodium knowlesi TaxID=5850 RepID=A0A5K1TVX2_PLAKH|nr:peptidase family C50, putative [Plasmodium knowlesi strain H]OTN64241.1 putative C50 peptidase [Plasmodium knowlesi]CAA9990908.1 peptidase family C50, putative [Plasmodium knowlesi strain H]SBO20868.1 C50 peptidase, putative [Plasmodium knowlesi strain H]SBO21303.1 C50 peptidase, putative [Plasmodium knowlesi strain H]VVS80382.1 peptidase family C50, putative [Plasmodium knowlesi strain H]|eukprot:XP_002262194.1 C50 peptidase, putative [Plasmodium knowlesi strain H]